MRQSFYIGVKTIIERNGKVLIMRDVARDKWEFPGGRIDHGQSIEDAAGRELGEEIPGAKLKKLSEVVHVATGDFKVEDDHRLCLLFYRAEATLPRNIELSDEHHESAWVGLEAQDGYNLFASDRAALIRYFVSKE